MRTIEYRTLASIDFESAVVYIAVVLASPNAAQNTANELLSAIERVADLPESGKEFSDERLDRTYRRVLAAHHWIYYTYDADTLIVHRIFHEKQDIDAYALESLDAES